METSKTISAALKLVDNKKENLKKAYDDLQSHSSLFSSFPFSWSNLDSHFTSIQNTLSQRFIHLQSLESQFQQNQNDPSTSNSKLPNSEAKVTNFSSFPNDPSSFSNHISHLEALNVFCKNKDGKGLRNFIADNFKDKFIMKKEIQSAFKCASDPADMVLDSVDGVFGAKTMIDGKEIRMIKKSCNFLFQQLRIFSPYVSFDVRKKAKRLFSEWKVNLVNENPEPFWAMAFLQFVAAFSFLSELNVGDLAAYSASAAATDEKPDLYQIIALSDRVEGVIEKLIERGKHVLAVKYIFHFKLTDKMPPVPILKACVTDSQKLAQRLAAEGKSLNEVKSREIHALKSVIKIVESYKLESELPRASLEKRIAELTKQRKAGVKPVAPAFAAKPHQHQQQLSGIKRPLMSAPYGPAVAFNNVGSASSTLHNQYQRPHFQSTSLFPEHPNPYMSMSTMPFGIRAPIVSSYLGPSTGPYGLDSVPMAPSGNLHQGASHLNSSEPKVMPDYYDPMVPSGSLNQGVSHPNSSEPQTLSGHYAPMGTSGNLDQGGSHPNPSEPQGVSGYHDRASASGGYGLQHYYGTSYPQ